MISKNDEGCEDFGVISRRILKSIDCEKELSKNTKYDVLHIFFASSFTRSMMNDTRRGTPKKRFLWRRLLPNSKPEGDDNKNNNSTTNDESQASLKTACHEQKQERKMHIAISPPLSEEEDTNAFKAAFGAAAANCGSCHKAWRIKK